MAISMHDPEWKRTIAMAALAGVTFQQAAAGYNAASPQATRVYWIAKLPDGQSISDHSKIAVARRALLILGADLEFARRGKSAPLPACGASGLRSSST